MQSIPFFSAPATQGQRSELAERLSTVSAVHRVESPPNSLFLIDEQNQLGLCDEQWPKVKPVIVDFVSGQANHRRIYGGGVGQALPKAIGLQRNRGLSVVDGTAGLGRDAFVLASLGAHVQLFERQPIVQLLLEDGLLRLSLSDDETLTSVSSRLNLTKAPVGEQWDALSKQAVDVVYLDPMFPEREKSAKVKKDMSLFHALVGIDEDSDDLLAQAIECARYRVVVKRSKQAPFLANKKPTTSLTGKSTRFDIYVNKAIPTVALGTE